MASGNEKAFNDGIRKARQAVRQRLLTSMAGAAEGLVNDAISRKGYLGFTGNTLTSLTCGVYDNGELDSVVAAGDYYRKPVRAKVRKGETVYLSDPYEGPARAVSGKVGVDSRTGQESAEAMLGSLSPSVKEGVSLIMVTGTEYSEYLERERDLNVLTGTADAAGGIVKSHMEGAG